MALSYLLWDMTTVFVSWWAVYQQKWRILIVFLTFLGTMAMFLRSKFYTISQIVHWFKWLNLTKQPFVGSFWTKSKLTATLCVLVSQEFKVNFYLFNTYIALRICKHLVVVKKGTIHILRQEICQKNGNYCWFSVCPNYADVGAWAQKRSQACRRSIS